MAEARLITAAMLVATPWKNGLGVSRDIASATKPGGGFGWTISIAELERDAAFSHYPEVDRVFTPIAGTAPSLSFAGGPFEPCPLLVPTRFPGDGPTPRRGPGPGRAFNVFHDCRAFRAAVAVLPLRAGTRLELPDAPVVLLHCLSGGIEAAAALHPGDSLWSDGAPGIATAVADGVGISVAIYGIGSA